jgi:hypothetical protein
MIMSLTGGGGLVMLKPCIVSAICTSPQRQAVSRVERDQRRVERADEHAVAEHRDAAVDRLISFGLRTFCARW